METIAGSQMGIQQSLQPNNKPLDSLKGNEGLMTIIQTDYWGSYTKVESTAQLKTKAFGKIALLGGKGPIPKPALYVTNRESPIQLLENTQLEGLVVTGEKGIRGSTLFKHAYKGKKPTTGTLRKGAVLLPKLDENWLAYVDTMLGLGSQGIDIVGYRGEGMSGSFFEPVLRIYKKGPILISEAYAGHIIIKSETEIRIGAMAKLEDITLAAPKVIVESGFKGNLHIIARNHISIGANSHLEYPSSLVLVDNTRPEGPTESPLVLEENTSIHGNVIYLTEGIEALDKSMDIFLSPTATIHGNVYCTGNMVLLGTVEGSVYTHGFVVEVDGSKRSNHILNGRILGNVLPDAFCGLPFSETHKGIAKWLY